MSQNGESQKDLSQRGIHVTTYGSLPPLDGTGKLPFVATCQMLEKKFSETMVNFVYEMCGLEKNFNKFEMTIEIKFMKELVEPAQAGKPTRASGE